MRLDLDQDQADKRPCRRVSRNESTVSCFSVPRSRPIADVSDVYFGVGRIILFGQNRPGSVYNQYALNDFGASGYSVSMESIPGTIYGGVLRQNRKRETFISA